jgi:hypothetical protein
VSFPPPHSLPLRAWVVCGVRTGFSCCIQSEQQHAHLRLAKHAFPYALEATHGECTEYTTSAGQLLLHSLYENHCAQRPVTPDSRGEARAPATAAGTEGQAGEGREGKGWGTGNRKRAVRALECCTFTGVIPASSVLRHRVLSRLRAHAASCPAFPRCAPVAALLARPPVARDAHCHSLSLSLHPRVCCLLVAGVSFAPLASPLRVALRKQLSPDHPRQTGHGFGRTQPKYNGIISG